jgi:outer membrane receptor protein involved in Fe transport
MTNPSRVDTPFVSNERGNQLLLVLLFTLIASAVADRAFAEMGQSEAHPVEFNIPAQSVPAALSEFARQARLQLLFISDGFEDIQANAVVGTFATQHALDLLLAGTGLAASVTSDAGVKVRRVSASMNSLFLGSQVLADDAKGGVDVDDRKDATTQKIGQAKALEPSGKEQKPRADIEEIIVTGSNIRGIESVGVGVVTLDRVYIEQSGIATTTELIQSLPQNFGLGNEAVETVGFVTDAGVNFGYSSSVNLRGLGSDSTLILLNGRRSASGGGAGNFVDLNTIPTSAIERIDVLPDGASAIYGSDAVGGVVNVVLRDNYDGAETSVRYAPGTSDIDEIQFSQVLGKSWDSGNVLFSYEYYDRSELKAADRVYTRDADLTSLGGGNHRTSLSNPGNIISPFTFLEEFAIPTEQDGTALTPADLIAIDPLTQDGINLQNQREGSYILPKQTRHSVFVSASQWLSNTLELFGEARYSARDFELFDRAFGSSFIFIPNTNAFFVDAFGGSEPYFLNYNFIDDIGSPRNTGDVDALGGVLGANLAFGNSWDLEVYCSYGTEDTSRFLDRVVNTSLLDIALADSDPTTAFNPYADGSNTNPATIAAIQGFNQVDIESELSTVNALLQGSLLDVQGGAVVLALGAQYRNESLSSNEIEFLFTPDPVSGFAGFIFNTDRDIRAAFAEVYLPLVSDQNRRPGINKLTVSIATRYEDYSDFGDTTNPKLGVSWSPVKSLTIRGSVGTSFRAPLLEELNTSVNSIRTRDRVDPASPTGMTLALTLSGNSPNLKPQEGDIWTAGFDVTPESLPGFEFGLTYFSTEVDNVIRLPLEIPGTIFLDPVTNAPIIRRIDPSNHDDIADVVKLLNDPACTHPSCATPAEQIGAVVDGRVQNLAKVELSGLDFNAAYAVETVIGDFGLSFYASHLFEFKQQLLNGPLVDNIDIVSKPNSLNLRSSLSWSLGEMNAAVIGQHIGDYSNTLASPSCLAAPCPVSSWTTWDVQLGYDFSDRFSGLLDGTKASLSIRNVFDQDPPFVDIGFDAGVGFDAINAHPLGRFAALQLTKTWW